MVFMSNLQEYSQTFSGLILLCRDVYVVSCHSVEIWFWSVVMNLTNQLQSIAGCKNKRRELLFHVVYEYVARFVSYDCYSILCNLHVLRRTT